MKHAAPFLPREDGTDPRGPEHDDEDDEDRRYFTGVRALRGLDARLVVER